MKNLRKTLSLFLSLLMVLSCLSGLTFTAEAATSYTITLDFKGVIDGKTSTSALNYIYAKLVGSSFKVEAGTTYGEVLPASIPSFITTSSKADTVYTFVGWSSQSNSSKKVDLKATVTKNLKVYAMWTTANVQKHTHSFSKEVSAAVKPTCTTTGTKAYKRCIHDNCIAGTSDTTGSSPAKDIDSVEAWLITPEADRGGQIAKDTVNGHSYGGYTSNGDGTHTRTCSVCTEGTDNHIKTESCSGGEATCMAAAVCKDCGESYGEKNAENHVTEGKTRVDAQTATCRQIGWDAYEVCACGETFGYKEYPMTEHIDGDGDFICDSCPYEFLEEAKAAAIKEITDKLTDETSDFAKQEAQRAIEAIKNAESAEKVAEEKENAVEVVEALGSVEVETEEINIAEPAADTEALKKVITENFKSEDKVVLSIGKATNTDETEAVKKFAGDFRSLDAIDITLKVNDEDITEVGGLLVITLEGYDLTDKKNRGHPYP